MENFLRQSTNVVLNLVLLALGACDKKSEGTGAPAEAASDQSTIKVTVDAAGYHPSEAKAKAGKPIRLEFTRTSEEGCGHELVFPGLGIKKDLPLNQPVNVDVTMPASGKLAFTCGMDMYRGAVVAE
jgi:plastocyanin domain-containing protein